MLSKRRRRGQTSVPAALKQPSPPISSQISSFFVLRRPLPRLASCRSLGQSSQAQVGQGLTSQTRQRDYLFSPSRQMGCRACGGLIGWRGVGFKKGGRTEKAGLLVSHGVECHDPLGWGVPLQVTKNHQSRHEH